MQLEKDFITLFEIECQVLQIISRFYNDRYKYYNVVRLLSFD